MRNKVSIPVYSLRDRAEHGIEIKHMDSMRDGEPEILAAHRDEHYLLVLLEQGHFTMMIDFESVLCTSPSVLCILPGQVHQAMDSGECRGWILSIDVSFFAESFRAVFEGYAHARRSLPITTKDVALLRSSLALLLDVSSQTEPPPFHEHTLHALADGCISLFAAAYARQEQSDVAGDSRAAILTRQFRRLLLQQFRDLKSPSAYAEAMHISPTYLNEVVKEKTGFSVSHWIQQEVMLEAKRLLYYTNNTVKEIAHALGYDDPTYFTRLFSKATGASPLQFRQQYRE